MILNVIYEKKKLIEREVTISSNSYEIFDLLRKNQDRVFNSAAIAEILNMSRPQVNCCLIGLMRIGLVIHAYDNYLYKYNSNINEPIIIKKQ